MYIAYLYNLLHSQVVSQGPLIIDCMENTCRETPPRQQQKNNSLKTARTAPKLHGKDKNNPMLR